MVCLAAILAISCTSGGQNEWTAVSDHILSELRNTHPESADIYARGTAGISVDRTNGDLFLLANNIGICRSSDKGQSFRLVSGDYVTGRFETGWGLNIDPNGRRLMCFTIYGKSAFSPDAGKTWKPSSQGHLDYGAVDWSDNARTFLAIGHESGGKLLRSKDQAASWTELGTGFWGVGAISRNVVFATKANGAGILRSANGGETWVQVSDEKAAAPVMVYFQQTCYWLVDGALIVSEDQGKSWHRTVSCPQRATLGPMFGRDARQMVVGAPDGPYHSADGGQNWTKACDLAPDIKVLKGGLYGTYGWDPQHGIFYGSQMMKPAYRLAKSHRPGMSDVPNSTSRALPYTSSPKTYSCLR